MFDFLHDKLEGALKRIRGKASVSAADVESTMREVRMALLEADVNFKVAKEFADKVSARAVGSDVLKSLSPDQQIIKIVHQELVEMMGKEAAPLDLRAAPPVVILMVGLQGSGKTTSTAKLARMLKEKFKRNPILVPADVQRPAAIDQLKTLGKAINIEVFDTQVGDKVIDIAVRSKDYATKRGFDTMIVDTAGRLQIDELLMNELKQVHSFLKPTETLLVIDAMTGQEAVNVATAFDAAVQVSGIVLTKLDGDARGGAALSVRAATGKPIKFVGIGEKTDQLDVFHPERMASRILGMGDVMSLIEKATAEVKIEDAAKLQKKMRKDGLTLEDFLDQMRMIKRMGSLSSIMAMVPGMGKFAKQVDEQQQERELKRIEAIILSMTKLERRDQSVIDANRRRRIAKGSGTTVEEVNKLLKSFQEMRKMMKQLSKMGMPGGAGGGLGGMFGGGMPNLQGLFRK
jgi:signal recognition particle subunit SRP54